VSAHNIIFTNDNHFHLNNSLLYSRSLFTLLNLYIMSHLKQLLLIVLVLCTLGYSSAWAFDEHVMEQLEDESNSLSITAIDLSNTDLSHNQNEPDVACDHCCHISSHLVAIFSDTSCLSTVSTSIRLSNLTKSYHSFTVSPDLKPPRV
jgi:hypothetical protein